MSHLVLPPHLSASKCLAASSQTKTQLKIQFICINICGAIEKQTEPARATTIRQITQKKTTELGSKLHVSDADR